ncbi:MAG TPA: hypothetical protein VF486_01870 [Actinomycetes bacterium]
MPASGRIGGVDLGDVDTFICPHLTFARKQIYTQGRDCTSRLSRATLISANDASRTSDDTAAIHALLDRLADAWARATYATYLGTLYQGPDDIGS